MSELINSTANKDQIAEVAHLTNARAQARGGNIAIAADKRLSAALAMIEAAVNEKKAASEALLRARAALEIEDRRNRKELVTLRSTMWVALDRPRSSPEMDRVFPGGVDTYTRVAPEKRPILMRVLASRIRSTTSDGWTPETREGWAAQVDALCVAFEKALTDFQAAETADRVADAGYGASVLSGHVKLRAFKRDLLSMGMTSAQAHDIIPSASTGNGGAKKPAGTGTTPGVGAPAPGADKAPPANNNNSGSAAA